MKIIGLLLLSPNFIGGVQWLSGKMLPQYQGFVGFNLIGGTAFPKPLRQVSHVEGLTMYKQLLYILYDVVTIVIFIMM